MKKVFFKKYFFIIGIFCMVLLSGLSISYAEGVNIDLIVQSCNNNNVCESVNGENVSNCSNDCQSSTPIVGGSGGSGFQIPNIKIPNILIATITPSISNFQATQVENGIMLKWENPSSNNFSGVKIFRSSSFFPLKPNEGELIYDGKGTFFKDLNFSFNTKYYYSAFSYGTDNFVSPAVLAEKTFKYPISPEISIEESSTSTKPIDKILPPSVVVFSQNDLVLPVEDNIVRVYPYNNLSIVADTSRILEPVKTIILRIQNPAQPSEYSSYSFISGEVGNNFQTVFKNFDKQGLYPFKITFYGINNQVLGVSTGSFDVRSLIKVEPELSMLSKIKEKIISTGFDTRFRYFSLIFLIFLLIKILYKIKKKI